MVSATSKASSSNPSSSHQMHTAPHSEKLRDRNLSSSDHYNYHHPNEDKQHLDHDQVLSSLGESLEGLSLPNSGNHTYWGAGSG